MSQRIGHGLVLSLCDHSGNMVRPWAEAGYDCLAVDVKHDGTRIEDVGPGRIRYVGADITDWLPPRAEYAICFAFPPCTNLAVSGARWFQDKGLGGLDEGLTLVQAARRICQWTGAPWMLENPVSTISSYWRKPDTSFHPYEFDGYSEWDECYTKETCLWTSEDFRMPEPHPNADPDAADDRIHKMGPGEDRNEQRSRTPLGFARAVFAANTQEHMQYTAATHGPLDEQPQNKESTTTNCVGNKRDRVWLGILSQTSETRGRFRKADLDITGASDRTIHDVLSSMAAAGYLDHAPESPYWTPTAKLTDLLGAPLTGVVP